MKKYFWIFLLPVLYFEACYNDNKQDLYPSNATPCDTSNVTFAQTIMPIMNQSCALSNCHDDATAQYGVILTSYNGVKQVAADGRLISTVTHAPGAFEMPDGKPKLDDCTIKKIQIWVNNGFPNN